MNHALCFARLRSCLPSLRRRTSWGLACLVPLASGVGACDMSFAQSTAGPKELRLQRLLKSAAPGSQVRLERSEYGTVRIENLHFPTPVTVDLSNSRFTKLEVWNSSGIRLINGKVVGQNLEGYGVQIEKSSAISIVGFEISGAMRGIVIGLSSDIVVQDNVLTKLRSDGINLAESRRIKVIGNRCVDFTPIKAIYAKDGTRLKDGDHADCIQAWSRPKSPPTSDLEIIRNSAVGNMQGIFLGNHVRAGVDDGGFDRVTIRNNAVSVSVPNGIVASDVRGADVRDNVVETIKGSMGGKFGDRPVKANLRVSGSDISVCGNRIAALPLAPGQDRCRN